MYSTDLGDARVIQLLMHLFFLRLLNYNTCEPAGFLTLLDAANVHQAHYINASSCTAGFSLSPYLRGTNYGGAVSL